MARYSTKDSLSSIPLFSGCTKKELTAIAGLVTQVDVPAGRELTVQGDIGREFMIIVKGSASVKRNGQRVAILGPGDFFGELALLANVPRTATVVSETDMTVHALNSAEFLTLMDQSPTIARKITAAVAKRSYENEQKNLH